MVTFYMHGNRMTSGVPGTHTGLFYGQVFDGKSRLFSFGKAFTLKTILSSASHSNPAHTLFLPAMERHQHMAASFLSP
jgi:hypothetical protein